MSEQKKKKPARAPAKPKKAASGEKTAKSSAALKTSRTAVKKAAPKAKTAAKSAIAAGIPEAVTHHQIAARAYGYFLERHGKHGHHEQDWLRAERELRGVS
jgi:hypothetical protein